MDYLLDEGQSGNDSAIREDYNLAAYGYGCSKVKKDRVVRDKYPDATIYPLLGQQDPNCVDLVSVTASDCRTSPMDRLKQAFYLVEKENRQFLVTVTDTFVETRPLEHPLQGNSFCMDGWNFVKCNYALESL